MSNSVDFLSTPWTHLAGPGNALPEYPRPQLVRDRWHNLNGTWEYTGADGFRGHILVPYPPESALSGLRRRDERMWYRRTVEIPRDWRGSRVLLHFGAVDQVATVWVNNQRVTVHEGGYTAFSADITAALRPEGEQEIVVRAEDLGNRGTHPVGKQAEQPGGILYTGASGIWQTVWLEPVPDAYVARLDIGPDLTGFDLVARVAHGGEHRVEVVATDQDGTEAARVSGRAEWRLRVDVPSPRLWSPDDPHLYDLTVRLLTADGELVDEVRGYTGLRTVSLVSDELDRPRIALNGRITFSHGPLDQGYWPDGVYTAPTDDALRFDLERTRELGFNTVRKHAKVEPARWYHWADRLGLLVWQDMPALPVVLDNPPGPQAPPVAEARRNFEAQLMELLDQLGSVPSIIGWVPFNEGWGEYDTGRIADLVKSRDPDRLVIADSGVNCCHSHPDTGAGDVYDDHTYVGPGTPEVRDGRATFDGEYGGLGLVIEGHAWPGEPMVYEMTSTREDLTRRYVEVSRDLARIAAERGLSGAIYTQTTDVENEVNGLLTYDRRVTKVDPQAARAAAKAAIQAGTPTP
ncbi:Glycosyl hydrolases family 2, TIM barrel domain [Amycolatopsis marina]|uniref:Glycosyl hydrolases family 2, TIM barrel domain n=1 Tax=Amycolatopsis marina TaxID=490629 RepID=A0A1I0YS89_9PSEU|nr:sugar-binding domain-containing protein [Amycolatopsis marina]SFB15310.1 Glycosyl hydrolases family 2, TIM barrel domain [Amycolatopsis marina]